MARGSLAKHLWQNSPLETISKPSPQQTGSCGNGESLHHGTCLPSSGTAFTMWIFLPRCIHFVLALKVSSGHSSSATAGMSDAEEEVSSVPLPEDESRLLVVVHHPPGYGQPTLQPGFQTWGCPSPGPWR